MKRWSDDDDELLAQDTNLRDVKISSSYKCSSLEHEHDNTRRINNKNRNNSDEESNRIKINNPSIFFVLLI